MENLNVRSPFRTVEPAIVQQEESLSFSSNMANTKNQNKKRKSLPRVCVFFSRAEQSEADIVSRSGGETWALVWKTKRDRRQTIILVDLLSQDRQWKEYQEKLNILKVQAKKTGCSTSVTDALDIVKIKSRGNHNNENPTPLWWLPLFDDDNNIPSENDQYQWLKFGRDGKRGRINCQFSSPNLRRDTEWSLILDVLNNCDSIQEIVVSGDIPKAVSGEMLNKPSRNNSATTINERETKKDGSEKNVSLVSPVSPWRHMFCSNNSITILHLGNFHAMNLSSIAMVRCAQAFTNLWSNTSEPSQTTHRSIIPSQIDLSKQRVARWNAFLSALLDMVLGLGVAAILVHLLSNPRLFGEALHLNLSVKQAAFQYLKDNIAWLETFPAGFKLNEQLTHTMGQGIRSLLDRYKGILLATIWDPEIRRGVLVPILAAMAGLGGWTTVLAFVLDLWRLEIIHVTILAACFRKLYQAELFLLSALFRLFRGKKRNVLRQRTDSMKYDAMQLLVGTIAFCVCVFLWTTLMVYYTFFLICNLSMHLPLMGCSVIYLLSRYFPFGSLFFRVLNPHWFPKDLYIQTNDDIILDADSNTSIQVGNLVSVLDSPTSILSGQISLPLKRLFNWYLVSFLEILCPRSGHKSHSFLPPTLLVDNTES